MKTGPPLIGPEEQYYGTIIAVGINPKGHHGDVYPECTWSYQCGEAVAVFIQDDSLTVTYSVPDWHLFHLLSMEMCENASRVITANGERFPSKLTIRQEDGKWKMRQRYADEKGFHKYWEVETGETYHNPHLDT